MKVAAFVEYLNDIIFSQERIFEQSKLYTENFEYWEDQVRKFGSENMNSCLNICIMRKRTDRNNSEPNVFDQSSGVLRFVRNYKQHHDKRFTSQSAFEAMIELFPSLAGVSYLNLYRIRNCHFSLSTRNTPDKLKGKKVDDWIWSMTQLFKLYNQEIIIEKVTLDTENSITTIKGLEIFGVDLNAASTKRSALGLLWSRALLKRRRLMFERLYPVPLLGTSLQQPGHKFLSLQYSS